MHQSVLFFIFFLLRNGPLLHFPRLEIVALSRIFRIPKIPVARLSSVRSAKPFFIDSLALLFFIRFPSSVSVPLLRVAVPKIFSRSSVRPEPSSPATPMCFEGYVSEFGVLRAKVVDLKQHVARHI